MTLTSDQLIAKAETKEAEAAQIVAEQKPPAIVAILLEQAAGYRRIATRS